MKTETSRRNMFAAGAAAIGATVGAAPVAFAGTPTGRVEALWEEFAALGPRIAATEGRIASATEALPAWAAPGARYIGADGSLYGPIVDEPVDRTVMPPDEDSGINKVARVSFNDLRRRYEFTKNIGNAKTAKAAYVHQLRKLARSPHGPKGRAEKSRSSGT